MTGSPSDALVGHGIQKTAQRIAVLKAVRECPHATADDLYDIAVNDISVISKQSVYDALGVFVDRGLVRRIQPVGSPALYEVRVDDNHHHVVCRLCGSVADVDCAVGEVPCLTADNDAGFEIDEAEVVYWGRCPTCQSEGREATRSDPRTDRRRMSSTTEIRKS